MRSGNGPRSRNRRSAARSRKPFAFAHRLRPLRLPPAILNDTAAMAARTSSGTQRAPAVALVRSIDLSACLLRPTSWRSISRDRSWRSLGQDRETRGGHFVAEGRFGLGLGLHGTGHGDGAPAPRIEQSHPALAGPLHLDEAIHERPLGWTGE